MSGDTVQYTPPMLETWGCGVQVEEHSNQRIYGTALENISAAAEGNGYVHAQPLVLE